MQISWTTVFLVEYFGPIFITAILYLFRTQIYRLDAPVAHHPLQQIGALMVLGHYIKREFETLFVHRFSNATMPFMNLFKNSTHYWIFFGLFNMYFFLHPLYTAPQWSDLQLCLFVGVFVFAEFMNLMCHITLRNLRRPGTTERNIPYGWGFGLVSCANYFWEAVAWTTFAVMSQTAGAYFFMIVSIVQMYAWAVKKHVGYKKQFKEKYPKGRKAMFPFIC